MRMFVLGLISTIPCHETAGQKLAQQLGLGPNMGTIAVGDGISDLELKRTGHVTNSLPLPPMPAGMSLLRSRHQSLKLDRIEGNLDQAGRPSVDFTHTMTS